MTRQFCLPVDADVRPRFTTCYLRLAGDAAMFVEAHTVHALPRLLAALTSAGADPAAVRWIVVTHAHLDHAAGAAALLAACPNATLLAHPRAAKHLIAPGALIQGATAVYGAQRFAELYGRIDPVPAERVRSLGDGEAFELGPATFTAWHTYGHAFHHLVLDDPALDTVYTGDTFGLVYPDLQAHGCFALPSTSPTGFDRAEAQKSLAKVLSLGRRFVCPTHFGAHGEPQAIAAQVGQFVDAAEGWVQEALRAAWPAAELEARFAAHWWRAIAAAAPGLGDAARELLALDVELNAQGLAWVVQSRRAAAQA